MQGLVVVPLFAGYDIRRQAGRLFQYDVTGGRYEESDFATHRLGQPARRHGRQDRLPRRTWTAAETLDLAISALFQAADEDSATGGPDLVRGIYPTMATITADGFERVADDEIADRFRPAGRPAVDARQSTADAGATPDACDGGDAVMSMPFYVAPEQVMKDRADYARKGIARGRSLIGARLRRRHPHLRREPVEHAAQGQRDLRPHRLRRRRPVQRVRPAPHRRRPPRRPEGLLVQPRGRRRPQPGQPVRPDPRPDLHPRDEADGGRDPRGRGRRRSRPTTSCSTSSTTARSSTRTLQRARRRGRGDRRAARGVVAAKASTLEAAPRSPSTALSDRAHRRGRDPRSTCPRTAPPGRSRIEVAASSSSRATRPRRPARPAVCGDRRVADRTAAGRLGSDTAGPRRRRRAVRGQVETSARRARRPTDARPSTAAQLPHDAAHRASGDPSSNDTG